MHLEGWVSGKSRYGTRNVVGSDERHDGDHSKTPVIELAAPLGGEDILINIGEVELGEDDLGKGSSLGVVYILGFSLELSNEDGSDNLGLSGEGNSLPSIEGVHGGEALEGNIRGEHTGEVESRGLDKVSSGGKHGNTGVLKLGSTEPSKGGVISKLGKAKRVEVLGGGSGTSNILKTYMDNSVDRLGLGNRGKSSSRGNKKGGDESGLHFDRFRCVV
eukprot:CAMPEP_0197260048 /NCGR_PEP_ID=MMETSP1429-20130617/83837_1 /TAXON_ID=49237 /ORGANISM="Chaetoceros  sp., Strain UNC1202" /LENGTH=217 /DNA_ID=CAMNT_0042724279 /DNA_START=159 /DNA_END=812 /DNA_ORIENTATION=-